MMELAWIFKDLSSELIGINFPCDAPVCSVEYFIYKDQPKRVPLSPRKDIDEQN